MKKNRVHALNRDDLYAAIVPFYEKTRSKLLELLDNSKKWKDIFLPYKLVVINNSKTEDKFYFYLTNELSDHAYLYNQKPPNSIVGFSTSVLFNDSAYLHIIDFLRSIFVHNLLKNASNRDIFRYFERLIKTNYIECGFEETPDYLRLYVYHLKLEEGLFAVSARRMNLIFPFADELDANIIKDFSAKNEKILITNKEDSRLYKGFDSILGLEELSLNFSLFNFTKDIQFYRDITKLDDQRVFSIIDLLKTNGDYEIYELKKELVNIGFSKGKLFEDYLERFLKRCLENCYPNLLIKRQAKNRKRIRIRDFIIFNNNSKNEFLKGLENRGVELLIIEAKNYMNQLTSTDIDTFTAYISSNPHFGKIGIILSRKGVDKNCEETIFRLLSGDQKIKILVLDQDDLLRMLDYLDSARSPVDVIRQKYWDLIVQM